MPFKAAFIAHAPDDDVARIAAEVGAGVDVTVARGDGPSGLVSTKAMEEAGWSVARPGA